MQSTTNSLLLQGMLTIQDPTLLLSIVCLNCHFIMCNQNQLPFDTILWYLCQLFCNIPNCMLNQPSPILCHCRKEFILPIIHHIRSLMSIVIQCLLVLCESKPLLAEKLTSGLE